MITTLAYYGNELSTEVIFYNTGPLLHIPASRHRQNEIILPEIDSMHFWESWNKLACSSRSNISSLV
jgi:hypothetical protein